MQNGTADSLVWPLRVFLFDFMLSLSPSISIPNLLIRLPMLSSVYDCIRVLVCLCSENVSMCVNLKFRYSRFHMIIFYGCLLVLFAPCDVRA